MTALYMDGFDHYNNNLSNMADAGWTIVNTVGSIGLGAPSWGTRTGPSCLIKFDGTGITNNYVRRALPAATTNHIVSFGYSLSGLPGANRIFYSIYTGVGALIADVIITPTGAISIVGPSINATTAGPVITPQNWAFIEMQFNTAGNFVLRVNDALGTDAPVLQTPMAGGSIALFDIFNDDPNNGFTCAVDDLFFRDATGAVNNGFLGDRRIAAMYPDEDTVQAGWTPHYYKQISAGHARLANMSTGASGTQSLTAAIDTAPASALNIGAAAFTLESFVRFDRIPTTTEYYTIFNKWNESHANGRSYQLRYTGPTDGNVLEFRTSTDGAVGTVVSKIRYPWQPDYGTWYHIALCRVAGQLLLFVDGVQLGLPITDGDTYFATSNAALSIGTQLNSASTGGAGVSGSTLIGRLDETRFTNGVGRYTASFSPPTGIFPRSVGGGDADFASVVLLMGYDSGITDESSYARTMVATNGATNIIATDGNPPGAWTTVGKSTPDDNTFIRASLTNATNIYTLTSQPANNDTVTVGTKTGPAAAVYTFKTVLASAFDVLIGATYVDTLTNLVQAINLGTGAGTLYGTGTTANLDVSASNLPAGQILVTALIAGTGGNSIASTESSPGVWSHASTLSGGANIPARSSFSVTRPPTNTTIISAVQLVTRARKTDAGVGTFKAGLVGPLGAIGEGPAHALTVNTTVYSDIIETDPDTSGPISPTTLINGRVTVNRTA